MKKTKWFPKEITPVRVGVYRVRDTLGDDKVFYDSFKWYAHWDGDAFKWRSPSKESAYENRMRSTDLPARTEWKGLAREPK